MLLETKCKLLFREYKERRKKGALKFKIISLCSQRSPVFNREFGLLPPRC